MMVFPLIREQLIRPKLNKEKNFYSQSKTEDIVKIQLNKFDKIWKYNQKYIPFFKKLVEEKKVPKKIKTIEDFKLLPIIGREKVTEDVDNFITSKGDVDTWVSTGGSTGNPLKFPRWNSESKYYEPSIWYARDFYDIRRSDRMFRLWGHSHVLGSGFSKYKKNLSFKIGHPLIGYKRFSAYDLSDSQLKKAGEEILKFKPSYIIGYSKALYLLAKANEEKMEKFKKMNLKALIGAAEGFDRIEDEEYISHIFGAPVGLEYATMESKLLAHTHPSGGYKTLWKNNLIECVDDDGNPAQDGRILVTSLYPKAFPLVRYELGDVILGAKKDDLSVYAFNQVSGRDNDFLMVDDKTPIHSESIAHAVKFSDQVTAYQIRYKYNYDYTLYLKVTNEFKKNTITEIRKRFDKIDSRLNQMEIEIEDELKQTVAGKTKWLIRE